MLKKKINKINLLRIISFLINRMEKITFKQLKVKGEKINVAQIV